MYFTKLLTRFGTIAAIFLFFLVKPGFIFAEVPNRSWEIENDKLNIRRENRMYTDTSADFLKVPSYTSLHGAQIAKTAPTIHFGIVQLTPEYLPGSYPRAGYGGWGDGITGPDGRYYFGIGNHGSFADSGNPPGEAYLVAYDPKAKTHRIELSNKDVCGWEDTEYGDGKFHGEPDIAPNGDVWLLGFWGAYPNRSYWGDIYNGGRFIKYNIYSRQAECLGQPVNDDGWPIHTWDWQRNRLYAIGEWGVTNDGGFTGDVYRFNGYGSWDYGKLLVYDTQNRRVIHGDVPKIAGTNETVKWWRRGLLLDRTTGNLYGTATVSPYNFYKYDPNTNEFSRMNATLSAPMISWPKTKNSDGSFYVFDRNGGFYKFYPEQDRAQRIGSNYASTYTESMRLSPGGRYLYYIPDSNSAGGLGFPIVQYDTQTGQNKVIAYLMEFYFSKYGYAPIGSYGLSLSSDGAHLYAHVNGRFGPDRSTYGGSRPAIIHVEIPASERSGDPVPSTTPNPSSTSVPKPGDANGDGRVDGLDYVIWVDNYGMSSGVNSSNGDFNGDGRVDGLDYVIWVDNYGS